MKKVYILMILFSFVSGIANCYAQIGKFDKDSLMNRFVYQLGVFPQEKVYLHTDKGTYMAGDTLWFRSYIVDATLHKPLQNKYIFVELVNPLDSIVSQVLVRPGENIYQGYLPLSRELVDGDYTLRAYSRYMLKNGSECIFRRPIRIVTVAWNKVGMRALSRPAGKSESLSLSFTTGGKPMQLQRAEMSLKDKSDIALKLSEAKDGFNVEWGEERLERECIVAIIGERFGK